MFRKLFSRIFSFDKKRMEETFLARSGKVFAKVVSDIEAKDLVPIIEKKVKKESIICSDTWWRAYTRLTTT